MRRHIRLLICLARPAQHNFTRIINTSPKGAPSFANHQNILSDHDTQSCWRILPRSALAPQIFLINIQLALCACVFVCWRGSKVSRSVNTHASSAPRISPAGNGKCSGEKLYHRNYVACTDKNPRARVWVWILAESRQLITATMHRVVGCWPYLR